MPEIPKIVVQRMQGPKSTPDAHPDADLLTAFAEKALREPEHARVMDHLAGCGDCREIVALALPDVEGTTTVARPATRAFGAGWFLRWGVVAAGIALAASVGVLQVQRHSQPKTAVSVGASTPQVAMNEPASADRMESAPADKARRENESARDESSKNESAKNEFRQKDLAEGQRGARPSSESDTDQAKLAPARPTRVPAQAGRGDQLEASGAYSEGTAGSVGTRSRAGSSPAPPTKLAEAAPPRDLNFSFSPKKSDAQSKVAGTPPVPSAGLPAASESVEVAASAPAMQPEQSALSNRVEPQSSHDQVQVAKAKSPVSGAAAKQPAAAPSPQTATGGALQGQERVQVESGQVESVRINAGPVSRWTISSGGQLRRSLDGGKTWQDANISDQGRSSYILSRNSSTAEVVARPQMKPTQDAKRVQNSEEKARQRGVIFLAVSAEGGEVWAGGMKGILYHSSDAGETWTRVIPASGGVGLSGDIVAIEFSGQQNGKVTTSSSETWTTMDAGQSWQKQ